MRPTTGTGRRAGAPRRTDLRALLSTGAVALLLPMLLAACSTRQPVPLRPEPRPWADTVPIPEPPPHPPEDYATRFALIASGVPAGLPVRKWVGEQREAVNLTHFDDVVSSSWFEHRNGRRRVEPARIERGPGPAGEPRLDPGMGLTVVRAKSTGVTPGFTAEDSLGRRYFVKFDPPGNLHLTTSAEVIGSRLMWAAGYHVPETGLLRLRPDELEIGESATVSTPSGTRSLTRSDLERLLRGTGRLPSGEYLAVASRRVPGINKGPWDFSGTWDEDPNDYYRHEHRRELRGLFVVSAWLDNVDTRFGNTVASYVEPGYIRHYLIDFGSSLGSAGTRLRVPREGVEHEVDFWAAVKRLLTLGFYRAGWEGVDGSAIHPAIGWIATETFDPGSWEPNWPNRAYSRMTAADGYWGAKLVGSFTDAQIRAAVSAGDLPEAAADTLAEILEYRRDRIVEHWYGRVTPIEGVRVEASPVREGRPLRVSFRDLGLVEGLREPGRTRYRWRLRHEELGVRAGGEVGGRPGGGRQTLTFRASWPRELPAAGELTGPESLARLRIRVLRSGADDPDPASVWLRWQGPEEGYRVVGLRH